MAGGNPEFEEYVEGVRKVLNSYPGHIDMIVKRFCRRCDHFIDDVGSPDEGDCRIVGSGEQATIAILYKRCDHARVGGQEGVMKKGKFTASKS